MSWALFVYLSGMVEVLTVTLVIPTVGLGFLGVLGVITGIIEREEETVTLGKKLLWMALPLAIVVVLVPSKETMYTMAGAYGAENVATSAKAGTLASKTLQLIEQEIDKKLVIGDK